MSMNLSRFNNSTREKIAYGIVFLGLFALAITLLPRIGEFAHYVESVLNYPFAWALTENENMLFINGIATGENFYNAKSEEAFLYFVYPPFFHLLCASLVKIFDFTILIPRLISLLSFCSLITLIFLFFKEKIKSTENILLTFLLGGFTLSITHYSKYYILARADMLAFALAFGSLFFLWQIVYRGQDKRIYYVSAGLLALAALLTKQSVFFPFGLIVLLTFFVKDRKAWLVFMAYLATASLLMFVTLQIITNGGFWTSMSLASEIYGKYLNSTKHLWLLQEMFTKHFGPLLFAIPILAFRLIRSVIRHQTFVPFTLLALTTIYINFLITGGNQGAEYNTLIPLLFGLILVSKELYTAYSVRNSYVPITIFFIICATQLYTLRSFNESYLHPTTTDRTGQEALIKILKTSSSQRVLGDRVDYATILAGKKSPLEASTHNVARETITTKGYAIKAEEELLGQLQDKQIDMAVVTITNFGKGDILTYVESYGRLLGSIIINYIDAPELAHKIYQITR